METSESARANTFNRQVVIFKGFIFQEFHCEITILQDLVLLCLHYSSHL